MTRDRSSTHGPAAAESPVLPCVSHGFAPGAAPKWAGRVENARMPAIYGWSL